LVVAIFCSRAAADANSNPLAEIGEFSRRWLRFGQ